MVMSCWGMVAGTWQERHLEIFFGEKKNEGVIQLGFEPGSSDCQTDVLPTEPLELWHWNLR